ncbi:MAG TPA: BMP family ABC transporter substrate-binding protein [Acidimicrobiales bacterium]|jgi:basic membrane protein A|nr:BMP family ABC transporter substrate-binding protein [Acidimicrobiales bacterium]
MQDHSVGGTGLTRITRRGFRAAAGIGALGLVAAGVFVGTAPAGAQAVSHKTYLACEVTDTGGLNDHSFNASAWAGMQAAVKAAPKGTTIKIKNASSTSSSDYKPNINNFIKAKCNIIVTVGFLMADATWNAAIAHPTQHFAIVDNTNGNPEDGGNTVDPCPGPKCKETAPNLLGLTYDTNQDGFLGGYEAAATSKTHVVATYGGEQFGSVTIYMDGFAYGVDYYNSHKAKSATTVHLLGWNPATQKGSFIGSFTNPTAANALTVTFLNAKASTIFPVAGGDGLGTTAAVQTWNSSHTKANVEWVDTSGCVNDKPDCSIFISSVTKGVTASVKGAVIAQASGKFKGGDYVGTLKNGGAAFIENSKYKVAAGVLAKIKVLSNDIIKGSIKVKT